MTFEPSPDDNLPDLVADWEADVSRVDDRDPDPRASAWNLEFAERRTRAFTPPGTVSNAYHRSDLMYDAAAATPQGPVDWRGTAHRLGSLSYTSGFAEQLELSYDEYADTLNPSFFMEYDADDLPYLARLNGLQGKDVADVIAQVAEIQSLQEQRAAAVAETYKELSGEYLSRKKTEERWKNGDFLVLPSFGELMGRPSETRPAPRLSADESAALRQEAEDIVRYGNDPLVGEAGRIADELIEQARGDYEMLLEAGGTLPEGVSEGSVRLYDASNAEVGPSISAGEYLDFDLQMEGVRDLLLIEVHKRLISGQTEWQIRHRTNPFLRTVNEWTQYTVENVFGGAVEMLDKPVLILEELEQGTPGQQFLGGVLEKVIPPLGMLGDAFDTYQDWEARNPDDYLYNPLGTDEGMDALDEWDATLAANGIQMARQEALMEDWQRRLMDPEDEVVMMYSSIAGGNLDSAMNWFISDNLFNEEQLDEFTGFQEDAMADLLEATDIEQGDLAMTQPFLAMLSAYGYHVPMKWATVGTSWLFDDEWRESVWASADGFDDLWEATDRKVKEDNYSPAQVLDIDGTFSGLALDLGAGIIADPFTYLTAGGASAGKITTQAAAQRAVRSAAFNGWADDVARVAALGTRPHHVRRALGWLGEEGTMVRRMAVEGADEAAIKRALTAASERAMLNGKVNPLATRTAASVYGGNIWRNLADNFSSASADDIAMAEGRLARLNRSLPTTTYLPGSDPFFRESIEEVIDTIGLTPKHSNELLQEVWDIFDEFDNLNIENQKLHAVVQPEVKAIDDLIGETPLAKPKGAPRNLDGSVADEVAEQLQQLEDFRYGTRKSLETRRTQIHDEVATSNAAQSLKEFDLNAKIQGAIDRAYDEVMWESGNWRSSKLGQWIVPENQRGVMDAYEQALKLQDDFERLGAKEFAKQFGDEVAPQGLGAIKINNKNRLWHPKYGLPPPRPKIDWDWKALRPNRFEWAERKVAGTRGYRNGMTDEVDGRMYIDDDLIDQFEARGILRGDGEEFRRLSEEANGYMNRTANIHLPVSPYVMAAATSSKLTAKGWQQMYRSWATMAARDIYNAALGLWMVDKLLGPRTAMVVSLDEMMRIYHRHGIMNTVKHQAKGSVARATRKLERTMLLNEVDSPWLRRLITLIEDVPTNAQRIERNLQQLGSEGWETLRRSDVGVERAALHGELEFLTRAEFDDAVRRSLSGHFSDSGFRAILRGEDEFIRWWNTSPDARTFRSRGALKEGSAEHGTWVVPSLEDAQAYYQNVRDIVFNGRTTLKSGHHRNTVISNVLDEFDRTKNISIPDDLLDSVDVVRGARNYRSTQDKMFNMLFDTPLNRRRSLIYRMEEAAETKRLEALFKSQNRTIIPDTEIADKLGWDLNRTAEFRDYAYKQILDETNWVPESYVHRLVSRKAQQEMDRVLYNWDRMSPALAGASKVAPFAGPWADMWGFWMREIGSRPAFRGGAAGEAVSSVMPFNPKPFATSSRLAATDFKLDNVTETDAEIFGIDANLGLGGLMERMGVDELNASSAIFLPTQGESIFSTTLPQPGPLPLWAVELLIATEDDPTQQRIIKEALAQVIPFAGFAQGDAGKDLRNVFFGGGLFTRGMNVLADLGTILDPESNTVIGQFGDIMRNVATEITADTKYGSLVSQHMRAGLADPESEFYIGNLLTFDGSKEELEALLLSLTMNSERSAAKDDAGARAVSYGLPVTAKSGVVSGEVEQIWVEMGTMFPLLFGEPPGPNDDPEIYANKVRNIFFSEDISDGWKRTIAASYPETFINTEGGWEWTQDAMRDDPFLTSSPFRSGPLPEDSDNLWDMNVHDLIQWVDPGTFGLRVLYEATSAKPDLAAQLGRDVVDNINRTRWDHEIGDRVKRHIDRLLEDREFNELAVITGISVEDPYHLWLSLSALSDDTVDGIRMYVEQNSEGLDQREIDRTVDRLSSRLNPIKGLDSSMWAYSTLPGIDELDSDRWSRPFRQRSENTLLYTTADGETISMIPDYGQAAMDVLGIDSEGVDLRTLLYEVDQAENENRELRGWLGAIDRVSSTSDVTRKLKESLLGYENDQDMDVEFRERLNLHLAEMTVRDRRHANGYAITEDDRLFVQEQFSDVFLMYPEMLEPGGLANDIWDSLYRQDYGDFEVVYPTAPPIRADNGEIHGYVWTPDKIVGVLDGDTIRVENTSVSLIPRSPGEGWFNMPMGLPKGILDIRLVGIQAPELGTGEEATAAATALSDAIAAGQAEGKNVRLVPDKSTTKKSLSHGRLLAWLYIGDEPYTSGAEGFFPYNERYEDYQAGNR